MIFHIVVKIFSKLSNLELLHVGKGLYVGYVFNNKLPLAIWKALLYISLRAQWRNINSYPARYSIGTGLLHIWEKMLKISKIHKFVFPSRKVKESFIDFSKLKLVVHSSCNFTYLRDVVTRLLKSEPCGFKYKPPDAN